MAVNNRSGLGGSLDLLQQMNFGQVTEGGGLNRPEPRYFNPGFGNCFRNY
jgi:hypothetical protein